MPRRHRRFKPKANVNRKNKRQSNRKRQSSKQIRKSTRYRSDIQNPRNPHYTSSDAVQVNSAQSMDIDSGPIMEHIQNAPSFKKWLALDYRSRNSDPSRFNEVDPDWFLFYDFHDTETVQGLITPRMAYKLHDAGYCLINVLQTMGFDLGGREFPKCCDPFLKKKFWRNSFIASIERVLYRLSKGIGFQPNCTAEEMAVHLIFQYATDFEDDDLWGE